MSEEPEEEATDSVAPVPESDDDEQTPFYQKMVEEYGDPFDGAVPIPEPTYSDLFESHEPLHLTDADTMVRIPAMDEVDTTFLNVTLADVLREARESRAVEAEEEKALSGPNGPRPNRKKRRAKSPAVTS